MARSTRTGVAVVTLLNSAFIPLDYATLPDSFGQSCGSRHFRSQQDGYGI